MVQVVEPPTVPKERQQEVSQPNDDGNRRNGLQHQGFESDHARGRQHVDVIVVLNVFLQTDNDQEGSKAYQQIFIILECLDIGEQNESESDHVKEVRGNDD